MRFNLTLKVLSVSPVKIKEVAGYADKTARVESITLNGEMMQLQYPDGEASEGWDFLALAQEHGEVEMRGPWFFYTGPMSKLVSLERGPRYGTHSGPDFLPENHYTFPGMEEIGPWFTSSTVGLTPRLKWQ